MGRLLKLSTLSSQFLNVLVFNGWPDETICGRAYREGVKLQDPKWAVRRRFLDSLFFLEKDHCLRSHELDLAFAAMVLESPHGRQNPTRHASHVGEVGRQDGHSPYPTVYPQ